MAETLHEHDEQKAKHLDEHFEEKGERRREDVAMAELTEEVNDELRTED